MAKECSNMGEMRHRVLDGELTREERARFEEHLASCPSCRRAYERLERSVVAFEAAPRLEPSPAFVAAVLQRAREAKAREARVRRAFTRIMVAVSGASAAAAAALWVRLFKPALGGAAVSASGGLVTTVVDYWKVARALAVPAEVLGTIASALGSAGSRLAWESLRASAPIYLGAFAAIAAFYLVWRAGSRAAALPARTI